MTRYTWAAAFLMLSLSASAQQAENHNAEISRNLEIFNEIYKQLDLFYVDTLSADTVIEWGINSMLRKVDPFTSYFPEDDDELKQMTTGKYAGIGSVIRYSKKHDRVIISEPYEDSPCQQVGLKAGDMIMSIDGKDVKGLSVDKVSEKLKGEAGTTFELSILRYGEKKERAFKITRDNIHFPQVPYHGIVRDNIGYLYLSGFADGSFREMKTAFQELKEQGAKSLILDLRDNPGGSLEESVNMINLFVPKGKKVVYTKGKMASTNREFFTATEPLDTIIPIVVMVDGSSASAAEILSGSLQDMDRAVIIGTRTYGKGLVQTVRPMPYGGNLKLTTSRYYIPSGRCIQAYNYRKRNADGSVGTVPDSLTNVFHTEGGREVRDGGGIKPDIEVKPDSLPSLIYDLVASEPFMDFAIQYGSTHSSIAPAGKFCLTDEEYSQFIEFVNKEGFTYNRRSDEVLKLLRDVAKREGYLESAKAELDALEAKFTQDLTGDLTRFREKIEPYICDEIVRYYYYQKGAEQQQLVKDPCIEKALELLANPKEYNKILHPNK